MTMIACFIVAFLLVPSLAVVVVGQQCTARAKKPAPTAKRVYRVGVLANRGIETASNEATLTFSAYLSTTAGRRFDPPISFKMVPVPFEGAIDEFETGGYDFIHANPGISSCISSEVGANSLVSKVALRRANGNEYQFSQFGGVIFTLANRTDINTLQDIRGKSAACVSIAGLGSGQMQFRELQAVGISHFQDLKQMVFTSTQGKIVNAVLNGEIDVGYVRTDQLERSTDPSTGELLDMDRVKIINRQDEQESDGQLFPFPASTQLYPEWNVASMPHVGNDVASAVQISLLAMKEHASILPTLETCYRLQNCTVDACRDECFHALQAIGRFENCQTTRGLAHLASDALKAGKYAGWRSTLSYMELRNMQEQTGFIRKVEGDLRCARSTELADSVVCPPGHFKKSNADIASGCEQAGIPCYGFQCLCSPCVKAFDVDFFPVSANADATGGCSKFSLCGEVEQSHTIRFRAIDNKQRPDAVFSAKMLIGAETVAFPMTRLGGSNESQSIHEFAFHAKGFPVGVVIVEVLVDKEQIPESPFRIQVAARNCAEETGDPYRVPSALGECICKSNSVEILSKCVPLSTLLPSILVPISVMMAVLCWRYAEHKREMEDGIWRVNPEDLIFSNPPHVLGRGSFGLVLMAEYRGTHVAVKRVIPPKEKSKRRGSTGAMSSSGSVASNVTLPASVDNNKEQGPADEELGNGNLHTVSFDIAEDTDTDDAQTNNSKSSVCTSIHSCSVNDTINRMLSSSSSRGYGFKGSKHARLQQDLIEEMRLISKLRHPSIATVMGAVISRKSEIMLVMEYMELGSLYSLLHNQSMVLEGDILLPIVRSIAKGLRFLHSATPRPVVHGDLKSSNVLVDSNFRAKVADFGMAPKIYHRQSACGTPAWMAPELLRGKTANTASSDIYAFGIVLYEIFSRRDPYEGEDLKQVIREIADPPDPDCVKRPPVPPACPREMEDLMKSCLKEEPGDRPTSEEIDVHLKMLDIDNLLYDLFPRHIATALRDGRKVEPETYDCVTVYFSDIVGYTSIANELSPTKVSNLLDRLYTKFDKLCGKHNVFKVETVGDAYMVVTNLAVQQPNHAAIMAAFAIDATKAAASTLIDEEDPALGYVQIRSGFNTGPVVAHVVGTKNPRYSLIGDTVNTAARMESNSKPGKIMITEASAQMLVEQAPNVILEARGTIDVKGKGKMKTYWVESFEEFPLKLTDEDSSTLDQQPSLHRANDESGISPARSACLVNSNVELLLRVLKQVVSHRNARKELNLPQFVDQRPCLAVQPSCRLNVGNKTVLDEVKELIAIPEFNAEVAQQQQDWESVQLPEPVVSQMHEFVTTISHMYRDVPFHNFEHASQVLKSASELLSQLAAPVDDNDEESTRISIDPLTHLSVLFSALIHDVDHPGVPNARLVEENTRTAVRYKGKSIAEQNSVDLAWGLFMDRSYTDLRKCICDTEASMVHFRQMVINSVMATDILDKQAVAARTERWKKAFGQDAVEENRRDHMNRKATILIEHLLLASDVAHTMQDWTIYRKWNKHFYHECLEAYRAGRAVKDPTDGWYKGEFGFFDFYVIPLATKLRDSGALGPIAHAYVENAKKNRMQWEQQGQEIVAEMVEKLRRGETIRKETEC